MSNTTPRPIRDAAGGTVPDLVSGTLSLADGGVWTAGTVQVGSVEGISQFGFGGTPVPGAIVVAASGAGAPTTLDAATIDLGAQGNIDAATPATSGTLDVTGGSRIDTSGLAFTDASDITIDSRSSVVLGGGSGEAGAVVVATGATLFAVTGHVFGNLVLGGGLVEATPLLFYGNGGDRFQIDGTLTGAGTIDAGTTSTFDGASTLPGALLEVGDATAFAGAINLVPGQLLVLDSGDAPDAVLSMTDATVDLLGIPFTGAALSYDAASGRLTVGAATLDVGTGYVASDFTVRADFAGGTTIIGERLPIWQAVGGDPGGDWGDADHWSTGDTPLTTDTVAIGPGIASATAWAVTATNEIATELTLGMGLGTLAVSGGLSLESTLALDSGMLLAGAGVVAGAPTYDQSGGMLDIEGGQFFTSYATLLGSASATVRDGGAWTAGELGIGGDTAHEAAANLDIAGGTLSVQDTLALGAFAPGRTAEATGTLALTDGAVASARVLTLSPGSALSLDGTSSLTVGSGGGTAGAGTILVAGTGTLDVTGTAALTGALLDQGVVDLGATSVSGVGFASGPTLAGALSGIGALTVASDAELGSAAGFSGALDILGTATLTVEGGAAPGGTVSFDVLGYPSPAVLDLRGVPWRGDAAAYDAGSGLLSVGATTLDVGAGLQQTEFAAAPDGFGGTEVSASFVACFAAGTRIATVAGEVPVECLAIGDHVRGPWGEAMKVRWLGFRQVDCARHPRPDSVWPVRVRAGAFRPGVPARDLFLSPDHALFIAPPGMRPVLIPVRCLIDGASVARRRVARVVYWHVELERHAVLLAEGLPCESFLDTGNRAAFANGGPAVQLHPDFAASRWAAQACAPQARGGPAVEWARRWLAERRRDADATAGRRA
jgi:hypothetical protein